MVIISGEDMRTHIWSYKEPLSDNIKSYLELLTEHLKRSERNQLITDIETHLGTYIQKKKSQLNFKSAIEKQRKIKSALDKTQQLLIEVNEILSEDCADALKMHLLENDEDKWLQLKVLELDLPNHLDSVDEIYNYLKMLDSLKDITDKDNTKKINPRHIFFCQFKKSLNAYDIEVKKQTKDEEYGNESKVHHLYRLIMEQAGVKTIEFSEFNQDCNS